MVSRLVAPIVAVGLALSGCSNPAEDMTGPARLADQPERFGIDIEAAGSARIPDASLDGAVLTIDYEYAAIDGTGEQRTGSMRLSTDEGSAATGEWRTVADNGTVYEGPLTFDFADDGTATGTYRFAGTTYDITIHLLD